MGETPNHQFQHKIFHEINHPCWGFPMVFPWFGVPPFEPLKGTHFPIDGSSREKAPCVVPSAKKPQACTAPASPESPDRNHCTSMGEMRAVNDAFFRLELMIWIVPLFYSDFMGLWWDCGGIVVGYGGFLKRGYPNSLMDYFRENLVKMIDLGVSLFHETPISCYVVL